jgi:transcriptional regulator with XRE-family HTH domain
MPDMNDISDRLRLLAANLPRGWQADLARHCGVKPPSVNGWLHGNTKRMEAEHLFNTADFFKVNPRWLAFGVGPRAVDPDLAATEKRLTPPPTDLEAVLRSLGVALMAHSRQTRETAGVMLQNYARSPDQNGNILQAIVVLLGHQKADGRGSDPDDDLTPRRSKWRPDLTSPPEPPSK